MDSARELADLIQLSVEDDVDDITAPVGHEKRAWLRIAKGNRAYKIIVIQQDGVIDEDAEDDSPEEDLTDMVFEDE